jgi:hypothetical protein
MVSIDFHALVCKEKKKTITVAHGYIAVTLVLKHMVHHAIFATMDYMNYRELLWLAY